MLSILFSQFYSKFEMDVYHILRIFVLQSLSDFIGKLGKFNYVLFALSYYFQDKELFPHPGTLFVFPSNSFRSISKCH